MDFAKQLCVPSSPTSISLLDHELRLWGLDSDFRGYPRSRFTDARDILRTLTDAREALAVTGYRGQARYLTRSPYGVHVALSAPDGETDQLAEPHFAHLAASFGAAGVPLECRMFTSEGEAFTVRDYVDDLCFTYARDNEPEFFASAMAHYLDAPYRWTSRSGATQSPVDLVNTLLSAPSGRGVCYGAHVPFALTMLLRFDDSTQCLGDECRQSVEARLKEISWNLTRSQLATGTWLLWADAPRPIQYGSDTIDRISVTGHHLEWMALAPPLLRPKPAVLRRAVAGLIHDLRQLPEDQQLTTTTRLPLTHAARALVLLSASGTDE